MTQLESLELKAFIPAQDFEQSKAFYQALGFSMNWHDDSLAYFHCGNTAFLLQNFYNEELAHNLMMHLLVPDVEAWWQHVQTQALTDTFGTRAMPPQNQPWRMRDFVLWDPSGVLWRIGQNIDTAQ